MKKLLESILSGVIVGIAIMVIDQTIQFFSGATFEFNEDFFRSFLYYLIYSVPLSLVNSYFFHYLNYKIVWKRYTKYRMLIGFLGSVSITLITIFFVRAFIEVVVEGETWQEFIDSEKTAFYFSALLITLVISLFFHAVYYYKELQKSRLKEQKVIAGTASAQFESLKNQIDPHFLFNSLNVLTSLIEENPHSAQRFTVSLSKIYRYVLEQKDKELVTVEEELKFAKTYMNLLKMRFENSIVFNLPEDYDNPEAKVVPLSLQLLLENTIKHNTVSEQKPLKIDITIEDNVLVVKNNLQKKEVLQTRKGVGLQNIVNRYAILTNRKVLVDETQTYFAVKLPILTKRIAIMEIPKHNYNEQDAYNRAKKRVEEIKGFYGNLLSYCVVIPFLIFINYQTFWGHQWFWYPMLGWGMGLVFHGFSVFGYGKSWEERKIEEILKEEKQQKNWN
ncbi:2TM domain-containing protein [Formosa algae]|uniref:Sensor histidine kinase YesM n=1 Tax=Formosa algae TaxID=225843 RepID=A0A9X0YMX8_9FLAO|nr:2TM domain-containing protein [Formosa algae]MBP1841584.1 sensor histidine kinase YesM [Formosa algae]MDQ0337023.1 sensor histidine kinase YesM [Formosa algae]OEI80208.1 histidine kinase [Formosa algae]